MRYALISDIHGNLEALQAVLEALSKEKIDDYLCIGDIVGYGADPAACIKIVRSLKPKILIAGNHEWGALGLLDPEYFNDYARDAVTWTKSILNKEEAGYLKSFRLVYKNTDYTLVHGSLEEPGKFYYVLNKDDAHVTVELMATPLCFVGHSHAAGIFYTNNGRMEYTKEPKVHIDKRERYVISSGSIGQPRDLDPRAAFAVYDTGDNTVELKRAAYDIKAAQKKIMAAGLPEWLAVRLAEGR